MMQHPSCSDLVHLLLRISNLLLAASIIVPSAAYSLTNSPSRHIAPGNFNKRQTEEEVCGKDFVLCDIYHCCPGGTYCVLSDFVWYCPKSISDAEPTSTVDGSDLYEPTTSQYLYTTAIQTPSSAVIADNSNASPEEDWSSGGGLQQKAIVGIAVGGGILLLTIAGMLAFIIRSNRKKRNPAAIKDSIPSPIQPPMSPSQHHDNSQQQYDEPQYFPQHPLEEQFSQQGQYPAHMPPSSAPQHYDYTGVVTDGATKQQTLGAGYYQAGYNGAVEAMSEPVKSPSPVTVPQTQAQGVPPPHPVYEM